MKALLYKEFRLALHPLCYLFIILFPLMALIPSYPLCISFIYVLCAYPILFLGANKGQQSNDLLFSTLMPVRKKDIVLARLITVTILQVVFTILFLCFLPLGRLIYESLVQSALSSGGTPPHISGFSYDAAVSLLSFAFIGFALTDLLFFTIYYKNGKSIVLSSLLSILTFSVLVIVFTLLLPEISNQYKDFFTNNLGYQFLFLAISLLMCGLLKFLTYKSSSKFLEKVDF